MTNWKADPKVQEAIQNLTTMYLRNDWTMADERRNIDALCEAVAASGSPPSPTPLNAKDKQDAERWRMFISKAHAGVTEDGDIWCGFSGGEPDDYTDVLTLKQVETLNNDDPSPRMAKDIVRRLIDDLVGARASSGSCRGAARQRRGGYKAARSSGGVARRLRVGSRCTTQIEREVRCDWFAGDGSGHWFTQGKTLA